MLLEMVGPDESISMAKNQSYVMLSGSLQLILRYLANALNCLCFVGDARGLEPLIMQNNILIERRRMITQYGTKNQVRISPGFYSFVITRLNLL